MKPEIVRLYNMMRVDKSYVYHDGSSYKFVTEKRAFKTNYTIPIDITDAEFETLKAENKTYCGTTGSPLIHKIRKQAIQYLKDTNAFRNN